MSLPSSEKPRYKSTSRRVKIPGRYQFSFELNPSTNLQYIIHFHFSDRFVAMQWYKIMDIFYPGSCFYFQTSEGERDCSLQLITTTAHLYTQSHFYILHPSHSTTYPIMVTLPAHFQRRDKLRLYFS